MPRWRAGDQWKDPPSFRRWRERVDSRRAARDAARQAQTEAAEAARAAARAALDAQFAKLERWIKMADDDRT